MKFNSLIAQMKTVNTSEYAIDGFVASWDAFQKSLQKRNTEWVQPWLQCIIELSHNKTKKLRLYSKRAVGSHLI